MDVIVGLSTTDHWISRAIEWFTGGRVSHVYIRYYDKTFQLWKTLTAEPDGFHEIPWQQYLDKYESNNFRVVDEYLLTKDADHISHIKWLMTRYSATEYDYATFLFAALYYLLPKKCRKTMKGMIRRPKKVICSESLIRFLRRAGYTGTEELDVELSGPAQIHPIFAKHPREYQSVVPGELERPRG